MSRDTLNCSLDGDYYNRRFEEVDSKQHSFYKYADDTENAIACIETFWKELVISPLHGKFSLIDMPTDTVHR